jgi:hypothetical protein
VKLVAQKKNKACRDTDEMSGATKLAAILCISSDRFKTSVALQMPSRSEGYKNISGATNVAAIQNV